MENFNIKRFGQTFKWLFCENSNRLLLWTLALTLGFFMIDSFLVWSMMQVPQDAKLEIEQEVNFQTVTILAVISFCVFIAFIVVHFGYSRVFAFLKTKQKRIAYLTLPATNVERFVAALVYILLVFPLCVLLALILGDTLRMFVYGLTGDGWVSGVPTLFKGGMLFIPRSFAWLDFVECCMNNSIMLWICSLYILGGTWFRRHAFFIVTAALITVFIIGGMCYTSFTHEAAIISFSTSKHVTSLSPIVYPITLIALAAAVFNFWWSYKIFTRFQIITSKWTNV